MTDWELIFASSKANGCDYNEIESHQKIEWPKSTWLQNRLKLIREKEDNQEG